MQVGRILELLNDYDSHKGSIRKNLKIFNDSPVIKKLRQFIQGKAPQRVCALRAYQSLYWKAPKGKNST